MKTLQRRDLLLWLLAPALMLWLDWHGLRSWFHQDDFAWLSLGRQLEEAGGLRRALFEPAAQGTVRVLSERLFFVSLERLFGLDHRPFHAVVLATHLASLALLYWVTLRASASRLAAAAAPVVWTAGLGLSTPLCWLSAYNQVLCAFLMLAAFACLLQWLETGRRAWFAAQAALLVLAFGALEIAVAYPAAATAWCWLQRRRVPRELLWLWALSGAFAIGHMALIPKPAEGIYARHLDFSMLRTFLQHASLALGGDLDPELWPIAGLSRRWVAVAAGVGFGVWLAIAWMRREKLALFGLIWFAAFLAPVLPLRDHVMAYYLATPSAGLAWMAASALAAARRAGPAALGPAAALLGLQLLYAGAAHRSAADWHYARGLDARYLFHALERAVELHPGKLIVVGGISDELFWTGFLDSRHLLDARICLDPGSAGAVRLPPGFPSIRGDICSEAEITAAARERRLVAYRWHERRLRAITRLYRHRMPREWLDLPPTSLELGDASAARWLGNGWHQPEPGGRWTARIARVTLAAPDQAKAALVLRGYRPPETLDPPVDLVVRIGGSEAGRLRLTPANASFELRVPSGAATPGSAVIELEIEASRAIRAPGDQRELGIFVSTIGWEGAAPAPDHRAH